ncbi:MAG: hypothetical protein HXX10_06515 [Rhodoplanes sp.]|uniref:hypothetical protein n=1 Tax=Rhodoplanes sp. TaxID=1968906 RepID=UPI0017EB8421|nr:hypothetical protein [Rhodoplanes sp.]NVO13670.1 hypothetical protein [Rhodoplanes sp.]
MTSISAAGLQSQAFSSPRDRLQNELLSEISSGTVSASDQSALSSALDSIDSALKSTGESSRSAGSAPPSPDEMKAKITDLINQQVKSGALTSDQADELSNIFDSAFKNGAGGPGGAGGAGGPPPGGPPPGGGGAGPGASSSTDNTPSSDSSSSDSSSSTDSAVAKLLAEFLDAVQQSTSSSSGYDANGKSSRLSSALVVDFQS